MKKVLFFYFILNSFLLFGQEFYTVHSNGNLSVVDIKNCEIRLISKLTLPTANSYIGDLTFTKDGKLYGVSIQGGVYEIEATTGSITEIGQLPNSKSAYNSMVSDANGLIYIADSGGNLLTFDPSNSTFKLLGTIPFMAAGDLIFHKGQLYMASLSNKLIEVNISNPASSVEFMSFDSKVFIYGIVSLSPNCQNIKAYAIAEDSRVFEIDFSKRELKFVCNVPTGSAIFGAASLHEFNAAAAINLFGLDHKNADCGRNNGSINVNASSGVGVLQYSIDGVNYQTQNQFNNLKNGTYQIKIQGEKGCSADTTIQLLGAGEPIIESKLVPNGCGSFDKGLIEVKAISTDDSNITYSLDSLQFINSGLFNNLTSGNYNVFVKTSKGCNIKLPFEIKSLATPTFVNINAQNTTCGLNNGSLTINSNNSPFSGHKYSLDNINFVVNNIFSALKAGNYTIYLKDSSNCSVNSKSTIDGSNSLKISQLDINSTTCGKSNGEIKATAAWSDGSTNNIGLQLDNRPPNSQNIFENLAPKTYLLKAISAVNTCKDSISIKINESVPLLLEKMDVKDGNCRDNDGQISITAKGNGILSYKLENTDYQKDNTFKELPKGIYNITIRDTQFCALTIPSILLSPDCFIYFPNTFSPNDDGINDYFSIYGDPDVIKKVKVLRIYNRWGDLMLEAQNFPINSPENGWNGNYKCSLSNDGVYTFYAEVEFLNHKTKIIKGDITLVK